MSLDTNLLGMYLKDNIYFNFHERSDNKFDRCEF